MTKIAHLLFFPGRNLINTTVTASVSSHRDLVAHITPHTSRGFRCSFPQFPNVIPWWERSPELTKPQQELCRSSLTSALLPAALGLQRPCWESSVLSAHGRRWGLGSEGDVLVFLLPVPPGGQDRIALVTFSHQQAAPTCGSVSRHTACVSTHGQALLDSIEGRGQGWSC